MFYQGDAGSNTVKITLRSGMMTIDAVAVFTRYPYG